MLKFTPPEQTVAPSRKLLPLFLFIASLHARSILEFICYIPLLKSVLFELQKSPLAPLFQRGDFTSLWKREVRRDLRNLNISLIFDCNVPLKGYNLLLFFIK
jgi:hypothetical protein